MNAKLWLPVFMICINAWAQETLSTTPLISRLAELNTLKQTKHLGERELKKIDEEISRIEESLDKDIAMQQREIERAATELRNLEKELSANSKDGVFNPDSKLVFSMTKDVLFKAGEKILTMPGFGVATDASRFRDALGDVKSAVNWHAYHSAMRTLRYYLFRTSASPEAKQIWSDALLDTEREDIKLRQRYIQLREEVPKLEASVAKLSKEGLERRIQFQTAMAKDPEYCKHVVEHLGESKKP
jgi:hypothetical protein